jgi:hypothetical protein
MNELVSILAIVSHHQTTCIGLAAEEPLVAAVAFGAFLLLREACQVLFLCAVGAGLIGTLAHVFCITQLFL